MYSNPFIFGRIEISLFMCLLYFTGNVNIKVLNVVIKFLIEGMLGLLSRFLNHYNATPIDLFMICRSLEKRVSRLKTILEDVYSACTKNDINIIYNSFRHKTGLSMPYFRKKTQFRLCPMHWIELWIKTRLKERLNKKKFFFRK